MYIKLYYCCRKINKYTKLYFLCCTILSQVHAVFLQILFASVYKCMRQLSKAQCNLKYRYMHVYVRVYGIRFQGNMFQAKSNK